MYRVYIGLVQFVHVACKVRTWGMYSFKGQPLVSRYGIYVAARGMNFPIKTGGEACSVVDGKQHKDGIDKECEAPAFFLQQKHHTTDYDISDGNNEGEE